MANFTILRFVAWLAAVCLSAIVAAESLVACAGVESSIVVRLSEAKERLPTDSERKSLPSDWADLLPHVRSHDVVRADGEVALTVVAVSALSVYDKQPPGALTIRLPKALLIAKSGEVVGELPMSYPDDPPFELEATFAAWVAGWPQRIELFVRDPTVSGDRALPPLVWDAQARRFRAIEPTR